MALRAQGSRKQSGSIIVLGVVLLVILIPLGVLVYDLTLIRQQWNQLKTATDAAALAAAAWLNDSNNNPGTGNAASLSAAVGQIALPYFRANNLAVGPKYGGGLGNAQLVDHDISSENLSSLGQSNFYVSADPATGKVSIESDFCVQPSLLSLFGLYTLHVNSVAGPGGGMAGDVCFVVDLSASMTLATKRGVAVVRACPVPKADLKELDTGNLIHRFSVPAHLALKPPAASASDPLVMPNERLHNVGDGLHPFASRGFIGFGNPQIPNPNAIDFTPSPNPTGYRPSAPIPTPDIPNTRAPRLSINKNDTPFLYNLINDFASKDPNVPITVNYPNWPVWPPVNPGKQFTYFDARGAAAPPGAAELIAGQIYDGSDPTHLPYSKTTPVKIKSFTPYTIPEIMTFVLLSAKLGYLDDQATFNREVARHPDVLFALKTYFPNLGGSLPFSPKYRREYQRLALSLVHPVETQVAIMHNVIESFANSPNPPHWSLVGFGAYAPGLGRKPTQKPPSNDQTFPYDYLMTTARGALKQPDSYQFPLIPLSTEHSNDKQVLAAIDEATVSLGTATPQGLEEGINQLEGPGHRNDQIKALILMTDGIPTQGGSFSVIKPNKRLHRKGLQDIRLIAVGLFECGYACPGGPRFVKKLVKKAGQNATAYNYNSMTRNCGKQAGDDSIDLQKDANEISAFIKKSIMGGGGVGLIQ